MVNGVVKRGTKIMYHLTEDQSEFLDERERSGDEQTLQRVQRRQNFAQIVSTCQLEGMVEVIRP